LVLGSLLLLLLLLLLLRRRVEQPCGAAARTFLCVVATPARSHLLTANVHLLLSTVSEYDLVADLNAKYPEKGIRWCEASSQIVAKMCRQADLTPPVRGVSSLQGRMQLVAHARVDPAAPAPVPHVRGAAHHQGDRRLRYRHPVRTEIRNQAR
jgi:hypothetical protein